MAEKREPFVRHGTKEESVKVSADEVLNAIAEGRDVDIEYAIIEGDLDIDRIADQLGRDEDSKLIVEGKMKMCNSRVCMQISFDEVRFIGRADFAASAFSSDVYFSGATFSRPADFADTVFSADAYFGDATFCEWASFGIATFCGYANFESAVFNGEADFSIVTFSRGAYFRFAAFDEYALFMGATFSEEADFSDATFGVLASFVNVAIERQANFASVRFREEVVLVGLWNYIMQPILCGITRLLRVDIPEITVTSFSAFNTSVMDGSSNPYLKRYIEDEQWVTSWRKRSWWRKVLFVIWELTSHCGRSIGLWAFWSVLFAIVFGFLYRGHIEVGSVNNWYTPFYFSVVTFTTLGFGDVTPLDWVGQLWITLEVILGYVMLGGLISIFANKFARRS